MLNPLLPPRIESTHLWSTQCRTRHFPLTVCLQELITDQGNVGACVSTTLTICHHGPKFKTVMNGNFITVSCDKNVVLLLIMIAIVAINFLWLIYKLIFRYVQGNYIYNYIFTYNLYINI